MVLNPAKAVKEKAPWLSLIVGNTRLHWGFFQENQLISTWHTPHLNHHAIKRIGKGQFQRDAWQISGALPKHSWPNSLPEQPILPQQLWIASAVPHQTSKWLAVANNANVVKNSNIPIKGLYGTLGCDRAINLLGAGNTVGWPVLVIDAGTALTFTAGVETPEGTASLYGGAILPGVRLQQQALGEQTAALTDALALSQSIFASTDNPQNTDESVNGIPDRWASDTSGAIASGLVYGLLSSITDYLCDWWQRFPTGKAIITGGDGPRIYALLLRTLLQENGLQGQSTGNQQRTPEIVSRVQTDCTVDAELMFWGMQAYRQHLLATHSTDHP